MNVKLAVRKKKIYITLPSGDESEGFERKDAAKLYVLLHYTKGTLTLWQQAYLVKRIHRANIPSNYVELLLAQGRHNQPRPVVR